MDKRLYVFDCGALYLDEQILIPGKNNVTYKNQKRPGEWALSPMTVYLVAHPKGYVLFDTGYHEDFLLSRQADQEMDRGAIFVAEEEQFLPQRLAQLNIKPEEITHVVQSHLHADHAGYLYMFKNADVYIHENEFTQTAKNYCLNKPAGGPYNFIDFERFYGAKLKWRLVEEDVKEIEILEGVKVLNFGHGHTYGNLGLHVELPNSGNFFLVSDALYTEQTINKLPGIVYDSLGYFKAVQFILKYAEAHNAKIIYGHNRFQMAELRKSPDAWYD
jgi:glyoxylase-like metal-dependent hydrolase (beta-lactamase superfamily II)